MGRSISYPEFVDVMSIQSEEKGNNRFWLKIPFAKSLYSKTLCVILKNPSTANNTGCDTTISRVCNVAYNHGYTEVIILNLFPYRSTQAKGVVKFYSNYNFNKIMKYNLSTITKMCNQKDVVFAWGTNTISSSNENKIIYDSTIKHVTSTIVKNTYYVTRCKCDSEQCNNQHNDIRYPLHGLRWCNNSSMISY